MAEIRAAIKEKEKTDETVESKRNEKKTQEIRNSKNQ